MLCFTEGLFVLHMKDLMMLLVMYCWKSRTLFFIHLSFMWEIFLDLHVNFLTNIGCRFVWYIASMSDDILYYYSCQLHTTRILIKLCILPLKIIYIYISSNSQFLITSHILYNVIAVNYIYCIKHSGKNYYGCCFTVYMRYVRWW